MPGVRVTSYVGRGAGFPKFGGFEQHLLGQFKVSCLLVAASRFKGTCRSGELLCTRTGDSGVDTAHFHVGSSAWNSRAGSRSPICRCNFAGWLWLLQGWDMCSSARSMVLDVLAGVWLQCVCCSLARMQLGCCQNFRLKVLCRFRFVGRQQHFGHLC